MKYFKPDKSWKYMQYYFYCAFIIGAIAVAVNSQAYNYGWQLAFYAIVSIGAFALPFMHALVVGPQFLWPAGFAILLLIIQAGSSLWARENPPSDWQTVLYYIAFAFAFNWAGSIPWYIGKKYPQKLRTHSYIRPQRGIMISCLIFIAAWSLCLLISANWPGFGSGFILAAALTVTLLLIPCADAYLHGMNILWILAFALAVILGGIFLPYVGWAYFIGYAPVMLIGLAIGQIMHKSEELKLKAGK